MMMLKSICIIFLMLSSSLVAEEDDETDLIMLNDSNFEHLTQASTGATTGDWLVMMYVTHVFNAMHACTFFS